VVIAGPGTPEERWRAWGRTFPPFSLHGCARLVVVAPHPDDEVLGVGGLMAVAVASGVDVQVVAVTDGGASHPGSPTLSATQLNRLRPRESAAALAELGVVGEPVRLRLPDGAVIEHEQALAAALEPVLREPSAAPGATWALTTWSGDGHPDHDATGRATAAACTAAGVRLLEHPVWTWHWAHPDDHRVPWGRAATVELPAGVHRAKLAAVDRFVTQVRPLSAHPADAAVLAPHMVARLVRPYEVVFT